MFGSISSEISQWVAAAGTLLAIGATIWLAHRDRRAAAAHHDEEMTLLRADRDRLDRELAAQLEQRRFDNVRGVWGQIVRDYRRTGRNDDWTLIVENGGTEPIFHLQVGYAPPHDVPQTWLSAAEILGPGQQLELSWKLGEFDIYRSDDRTNTVTATLVFIDAAGGIWQRLPSGKLQPSSEWPIPSAIPDPTLDPRGHNPL